MKKLQGHLLIQMMVGFVAVMIAASYCHAETTVSPPPKTSPEEVSLDPMSSELLKEPKKEVYTAFDTGDVYSFLGYNIHKKTKRLVVGKPIIPGAYRGHISFFIDPPFFKKHPDAKIKSITLELTTTDDTYSLSGPSYLLIDLSSLRTTDYNFYNEPFYIDEITYTKKRSGLSVWNAISSGPTILGFQPESIKIDKNKLKLDASKMDISEKHVMQYIGLMEVGDDDAVIAFNGVNSDNPPRLIIEYE